MAAGSTTAQGAPRARRVPVDAHDPLLGANQYDYADAFEIRVAEPDPRSAEEFIREALEQAPSAVRWVVASTQRHLLGLRLGPRTSPEHVLGWRVVTSEPGVVELRAESPLLGRAVSIARRTDPTCARITTYLFYERPAGARLLWMIAGPLHRRVAPYLLERAAATSIQQKVEA